MKNFRKVLALILVVATLFSFVAMASAKTADEYKDYEDVKYVEAVDVLTAIGITEGYDGAYHPADTIDRDEVAAMVARLRNGGDIDADLYVGADNVFADVKGQWSEGYVTYCAQLGIIAGRNASTFDPDGKVTGTEVLKMLLCVLGYDAGKQGYTGANWQVNVVRDAKKAGLLIDDVDPYAAATRDEVAQYFLNALKSRMVVGYIGEGIVKVTNSIWADFTKGSWGNHFEIITPDSTNSGFEVTYCNAVISGDYLWESIPGLKFDDVTAAADCFGRPGYKWTFKVSNKTILEKVYTYAADEVLTATSADALKGILNTIVNGDEYSWKDTNKGFEAFTVIRNGAPAEIKDIGNGTLVEVYAEKRIVVIIDTFIAKVGTVSERAGIFTLVDDAKTPNVLHKFNLTDVELKAKDMVLYHVCDGSCQDPANKDQVGQKTLNLHDVKVVEPVIADVTEGDNYGSTGVDAKDTIVAGGKSYNYAQTLGQEYAPECAPLYASDIDPVSEYKIYLDEYGYIIYLAPNTAAATVNYAYLVEGTAWKGNHGYTVGKESWDYTASLVNYGEDGAKEVEKKVAVDDALYTVATLRYKHDSDSADAKVGTLISYTFDPKGNFVFGEEAQYAPVGTVLEEGNYVLNDKAGIYANSETIFMIRTMNMDGTYSYEQITGTAALEGSYIAENVSYLEEVTYTVPGHWDYNDSWFWWDWEWIPETTYKTLERTTGTNIQYFVDADYPDFASYVFIDAKYQYAEADHFMVLGGVKYERFEKALKDVYGDDYKVYDAIVDGERAVVASDIALDAGVLYDEMVEFRGFTSTIGGQSVPLYVYVTDADVDGTVSKVDYVYEVTVGETYVKFNNKVKMLADDVVMYTIGSVEDYTTGKWALKVTEEIVTSAELALTDETIKYGYFYLNDDGEVAEVYLWLSTAAKAGTEF